MAKFDVTKNVVVPRGEYDDMLRNGYALARLEREHEQAQAEIEELTQAIDVLNRAKIEAMAAPKSTAEITSRPRAELIDAIRNEYWIAMKEHAADGAVNALTHRLFVTGTTTIRERLSRATILAALRDAGIHPLAPEPKPNDEFVSFEDDAALMKWGRANEFQFRWFRAAPDAREKLVDESRLNIRHAILNPPAKQAAPGAFLSAEEDRELVAMGREITFVWYTKNCDGAEPVGAISSSETKTTIKFGDDDRRPAFALIIGAKDHLTDAARALLRRVRDERKQATPKEGTDNDAE